MEIDPVILQLKADLRQYQAQLRSTTTLVTNQLDRQERAVLDLESQFRRSSGAISGQLRGLAAAFAGAFSARQVVGLVDSYTRLQNSLRVAGLEGERLESVQSQLLDLSSRYGVSIEELGRLFGNSAQAAAEFGGSQSDILRLTEATSQALLITGTSAAQAQGAILGLSQALAAGTVRAEEFNQINEGGLRPLLQAAAASDRFGGSVARLRAAVLDGTVSSREFFQAILNGSSRLGAQASNATLTLSGAFEALTSRLTVYVGEAARTSGATEALATAVQRLADNIDVVAKAVAVIAAVIAGRYVAGALAASAATGALGNAMFLLQARAAGAATSMEVATIAGRNFLALFGGPVAAAVTAFAVALGYAITRTYEAERATAINTKAAATAERATEALAKRIDDLASAHGRSRDEALRAARAEAEKTKQLVAQARATAILSQIESIRAQRNAREAANFGVDVSGTVSGPAEAKAKQDFATYLALETRLSQLLTNINAAARGGPNVSGATQSKTRRSRAASGPSAAEVEQRFVSDLRRIRADQLQDELQITTDAERRAALLRELDELEYQERRAQIENEANYTKAQRARLLDALDRQFGRTGAQGDEITVAVSAREVARRRQLAEEELRRDEEMARLEIDALDAEAQLVPTREARLAIERRILALQQKIEQERLKEAIASGQIAKASADEAKASLDRRQANERAGLDQRFESPLQAYRRRLREDAQNVNDAVELIQVRGLESLNDGLVDAIMGVRSLGDVFKNVANQIIADLLRIAVQRAVIEPLAGALFGGGGGAQGGGLFGGLFGRASGGFVQAGQLYRVNEGAGAGRVEGFRPAGSGTIVPLGQMNAARRGGTGEPVVIRITADEGAMFVPRVQQISGEVSVQVVEQRTPRIAATVSAEAMRRATRRTM